MAAGLRRVLEPGQDFLRLPLSGVKKRDSAILAKQSL